MSAYARRVNAVTALPEIAATPTKANRNVMF